MIGKLIAVLFVAGVGVALAKPFEGVDPNTLSCDPAGQVFLLLPHFYNCSQFYMCTHGEEVLFNCSAPLIFDFALQGCNWEWDAECILRTRPDEDGGSSEGGSEEDGSDGDEDEGIGSDEVDIGDGSGEGSGYESGDFAGFELEDGPLETLTNLIDALQEHRPARNAGLRAQFSSFINCNQANSASRSVAHKTDCQRFWRCVDGSPQAFYCTDGLFFNPQTEMCDFEANVKCGVYLDDELEGEYIVYK